MYKTGSYLLLIVGLSLMVGCSAGGDSALKNISTLLGGQHDQSVFKDTTVKEALEYEYRVCLGDYEGQHARMKQCVSEAYAKVVEEKGIGERPTGGEVIIKEVGDDEVINEDIDENNNNDGDNDQ